MDRHGDLRPRDFADRIVDRWPWVFLAGILGGILALALSLMLRPVYEASASIGVSIDYGRIPPLALVVEDRVLRRAADLLTSTSTVERVRRTLVERFGEDPAWASSAELRRQMRVDAMLSEWKLVATGTDPELAAAIANAWAEVGLDELESASGHAWEAMRIQSAPIVVACAELVVGAPLETLWECLGAGPPLTPDAVSRLREEVRLSHGVLPILSFELAGWASQPTSPVVWNRTQLVVTGMVVGLMAGALAVGSGLIPRKLRP